MRGRICHNQGPHPSLLAFVYFIIIIIKDPILPSSLLCSSLSMFFLQQHKGHLCHGSWTPPPCFQRWQSVSPPILFPSITSATHIFVISHFCHFRRPVHFPMSKDILEVHKCKNSLHAHFIVKSIHSFLRWCKTTQFFTLSKKDANCCENADYFFQKIQ